MRTFRVGIAAALISLALGCGDNATGVDGGGDGDGGGIGGGNDYDPSDNTPVSLEGTVYANVVVNSDCPNGCFSNPLPGAQVSTSLDGMSVTTGANGRFSLVTATQSHGTCAEWTVTITAQAYAPFVVTGAWGNHAKELSFGLFPPFPTAINGC